MSISYTYRNLENLPSILFGFKIHVSATYNNYQHILRVIRPYLEEKKIPYKFVENKEDIYKTLSVSELSAEVGKLVTIYPSPASLTTILEELYELLPKDEDGVYILSDRPYKDSSLLFYRFGVFQNSANVYQNGIPTMTNISGEQWQDFPKPYFDLPNWVDDIQEPQKTNESYLGNTYNVTSVLHQSGGGNVYLGMNKKYMVPVTLKEARPYILSFPGIEKKDLREKEYELSCRLKNADVKYVISPIERVDEWINTYYIYHHIQGESLTDFSKAYGINAYSRKHKIKNLRLYKEFLKLVCSLTRTVIYLHDNQLVLNDIHPDNFIIDHDGEIYFIDLENAYIYGEKPFVGIESKISLKKWNFVDGKQADFYKLGNTILFMLGRLYISEESENDIELLNRLLLSYGIETNLTNFIKYLFSGEVTKEHLEDYISSLSAIPIKISDTFPSFDCTDLVDFSFIEKVENICIEFQKYKKYVPKSGYISASNIDRVLGLMNTEQNLGLNGLSGIISLLRYYGFIDLAEEGINIVLTRLEETDEGLMAPIEGGYYSPYICNGISGIIQMLYYIDKKKYRGLILELRKSLLVEFAQYEDYNKGMLGIADTLLLTASIRNNNLVKQCVQSLILNSYLYHQERNLPLMELQLVTSHFYSVYSSKKSIS